MKVSLIVYVLRYVTSSFNNEIYYIIHPPNELPLTGNPEGIKRDKMYEVFVEPEIIRADEDLKLLDINTRKCYFEDERKLKYFKIYSQKNCELECLSHVGEFLF